MVRILRLLRNASAKTNQVLYTSDFESENSDYTGNGDNDQTIGTDSN